MTARSKALGPAGILAASLLGSLVGCGFEESYTGMGDRAILGDPLRPIVPEVNCAGSCDCQGGDGGDGVLEVESLAGLSYRFTELTLGQPLSEGLAGLVNGYFKDEIKKNALNVLLVVDADDREGGILTGRLGAGDVDPDKEGAYRLSAANSPVECELVGARMTSTIDSALDFPNSVLTPPALPIRKLRVAGRFTPSGGGIEVGTLKGALMESDALAVQVLGSPLATLLTDEAGLPLPLNLDTDGDGTKDAWRFESTFKAVQAEVSAPALPTGGDQ